MLSNWDQNASSKTTLVLPSVSAGNVGQLTVDAFISSLKANFLGNVDVLDCVLPMFGANPYSENQERPNVTAFSAHYACDKNVLLFQQRSELIAWKKKEFLNRLVDWLKEQKFPLVVLLCGCFAYARTDKEIRGSKLRYLWTPEAEKLFPNVVKSEFLLEKRSLSEGCDEDGYHLPGGGLAEGLYSKCVEEKIPLAIFLNYINEGDNYQDALELAKFCDETLKLCKNSTDPFVKPPSWLDINL